MDKGTEWCKKVTYWSNFSQHGLWMSGQTFGKDGLLLLMVCHKQWKMQVRAYSFEAGTYGGQSDDCKGLGCCKCITKALFSLKLAYLGIFSSITTNIQRPSYPYMGKILLQYLDHFGVQLQLDASLSFPPVCKEDQLFMDLVIRLLPRNNGHQVNVWKHHKIYLSLS